MTMGDILSEQAIKAVSNIMHSYYCDRDIEGTLSSFSEDMQWVGSGDKEMIYSKAEIRSHFMSGVDKIPPCDISEEEYHVQDLGEGCMVTGSMIVRCKDESKMIVEVSQRVSAFLMLDAGILKVKHLHISSPNADMVGGELFPLSVGAQNYKYLQRMLKEKTEVIEMISTNINGGLKGSNDDETFSYFYVNPGLPEMLGFTYEEFIEKNGGSAVGAVYPPDLSNALEGVAVCFAKGPLYSVEYRMEKKDGSLMWVMDAGRKVVDYDNKTKINSIILDITPLKTALLELEIERERYRTALENISDSLCEYDIENDFYVTYQRIEADGKTKLEKIEIPQFSKVINSRIVVHPDDTEKLMEVYQGKLMETIEVRTRDSQSKGSWHWNQVRCSVIYNVNQVPIRTIGTMKDITKEKRKESRLIKQAQRDSLTGLLNQATTKAAAKQYIMKKEPGKQGILMVLDLDHFKRINDEMGHLYGDYVLTETGKILSDSIRADDIAGRVGGDEFLILLKNIEKEKARKRGEEIIKAISRIGRKGKTEISCSIGIAVITSESGTYEEIFNKADTALYRAKNTGRKQCVFF